MDWKSKMFLGIKTGMPFWGNPRFFLFCGPGAIM